jgi:hypothetical protein
MLGMTLAAGGQEAALFRSQVRLRRLAAKAPVTA